MTQKQTIIWTALPNGVTSAGDRLRLSVLVSARLETNEGLPRPQLSQFPDFLNWTARSKDIQFTVQSDGSRPVPATRVGPALEPELWVALFKGTTYVEPYKFIDFTNRPILSHPVANVSAFLKAQYQTVGVASPTQLPARSTLIRQLAPISLYETPDITPEAATPPAAPTEKVVAPPAAVPLGPKPTPQGRGARPMAQQVVIPSTLQSFIRNLRPELQPSATRNLNALVRQPLPLNPSALDAFRSVYQDLEQRKAVRTPSNLQPARDFLQVRLFHPRIDFEVAPLQPPDIDFHKLISFLGNYPELMRRLGMVIDLEIPIPLGSGTNPTVQVTPSWPSDSRPSAFHMDFSPKTACILDRRRSRFVARPEKPDSDIRDGMLSLNDDKSYPVVHVDVDGSALKMVDLADRLTSSSLPPTSVASAAVQPMMLQTGAQANREPGSPAQTAGLATAATSAETPAEEVAGLPALRTGGISVAQAGRAEWLANHLAKAGQHNQAVDANAPDQATFYADQLVRGYRVDVWDSQSKSWHSLCQRKGVYNFFEANLMREYDDEGFVQLAVTQSPVQPSSEGGEPKDFYLHESMFTWNGWSLCAPRPGKTIAPDGVARRLDDPEAAKERATSGFKMVASFVPLPGKLPCLRFGTMYRMRARVVDLAGNSLACDAPDPADFSKATAPHLYTRFEPVVAPLVVLTKPLDGAKSPGESLHHLVVRSNFDKSIQEYALLYGNFVSDPDYTGFALRLIAPPKTSPLMAERHSMFDLPSGAMKKDQATYEMISRKAEGAFPLDPTTRLPVQKKLEVPYLPDPLSRGACLALLDANNHPAGTVPPISFYPSNVDWPNPLPLLLKVSEAKGKTSWDWDEGNRTLNVRLPKAEVVTFELSSFLGDGESGTRRLGTLGVWNWVEQASPAILPQVRQAAAQGRHWMVTPFREIVLVHAVQQPLVAPQFHVLTVDRHLGETYAYIVDDQPMPIDGKSTVKLDIQANWQEPLDDVNDPSGPKILNGSTHICEWKLRWQDTDIHQELHPISAAAPPGQASSAAKGQAAAPKKEMVVAPAVRPARAASEVKVAGAPAIAPFVLRPGERIPSDVRVVRQPAQATQVERFGYSWRQDFGDTKYRKVSYLAVATTRYAEYFPIKDPEELTRKSLVVDVDVPNTARPPLPQVLYVIPTFEWQKKTEVRFDKDSNKEGGQLAIPGRKGIGTVSKRLGGGLRVYLDRPWFVSGDGELLGVVLWPSPAPFQTFTPSVKPGMKVVGPRPEAGRASAAPITTQVAKLPPASSSLEVPDILKPLVTQWGMDPIWLTSPLPRDLPGLENCENPLKTGTGLTLDELSDKPEPSPGFYRVCVAGYRPEYDKDRQLWYCDIEMDGGASYFPFVRMALVRYQPISVENAHLSRVVLADFAQLAPDRTATLVYDPKNPKRIDIAVTGASYTASYAGRGPAEVEVTVEAKPIGGEDELGWIPVPGGTIPLKPEAAGAATLWRAQVRLDKLKVPNLQALRLVIKEYERFLADARGPQQFTLTATAPTVEPARRLVYADVLEVPPIL